MWICNDLTKENRKIKKTDPIPEGWRKGRISEACKPLGEIFILSSLADCSSGLCKLRFSAFALAKERSPIFGRIRPSCPDFFAYRIAQRATLDFYSGDGKNPRLSDYNRHDKHSEPAALGRRVLSWSKPVLDSLHKNRLELFCVRDTCPAFKKIFCPVSPPVFARFSFDSGSYSGGFSFCNFSLRKIDFRKPPPVFCDLRRVCRGFRNPDFLCRNESR